MFKKHIYTCPDVIHIRKVQKRNALAVMGGYAALFGAFALVAGREEKKIAEVVELAPED